LGASNFLRSRSKLAPLPQLNANDPLIGRRLGGRVEIRAPLGAGGMGKVYRGWHLASNAQVAVKVIAPRGDQPALARRLNVEVVAARRLKHPNVVQVLEAGVDPTDNLLFVVMEYVEGKDLASLLRDGKRLPIPRACAILREVLSALEEAHGLNVLHRDIKPGNIMLTRSREPDGGYRDQVKVVDFGLAKLSGELTSLTETGFVAGTPGFMAPEQALGEALDGRADVYACGVTLYRMLSGQMPFQGEKLAAVLRAMKEDPPPITGLPPELDRVLRWSLARERSARCPSARAFADALAPFAEGTPSPGPVAPAPGAEHGRDVPGRERVAPPGGLRLDAALGLGGAAPSAPESPPTINQRSPAPEAEAPRAIPSPPSRPDALPALDTAPPRPWWAVPVALAVGLGIGIYGTVLVQDQRRSAVVEEMTRQIAFGQTEEVEQRLIRALDQLRDDRAASRVALRLLELRRTGAFPFDPAYRLAPSRFEGTTNGHAFALEISEVAPWSFTGTLEWVGEDVTVEVKGLHQGNELLFSDLRAVKGGASGYVFDERKVAFVLEAGGEVHLAGYDGPKQRPLQAVRRSSGPAPDAAEEPGWARTPELSEADLRAYFRHRARRLQLEQDAAEQLERVGGSPSPVEEAADVEDEVRERRRRLETEPPLSPARMEMLDAIVDALFQQSSAGGRPVLVPRPDAGRLAGLRAQYGPVVDRVIARQSELFTAPRPKPEGKAP